MKTRKKTLLMVSALSLALGFGVSTNAPAQETPIIAVPIAPATKGDATPPHTTQAKPDLSETFGKNVAPQNVREVDIVFRKFSSYKQLLKLFPEARALIEEYGVNTRSPDIYTEGYFAKVSDRLYLFRTERPDECGVAGCVTIAFSLAGTFYPSAYILSPDAPAKAHIDANGEPSIFTCNSRGEYYEWKRIDGAEMTPQRQPNDCGPSEAPPETSPAPSPAKP